MEFININKYKNYVMIKLIIRGMGRQLVVDPTRICRKVKRLRGKQALICKNEPDFIKEIIKGAQLGIQECQYQFRDRKWNCTTAKRSIRKILNKGNH
jgi:wingless-type MMTV integration site family protein 6